MIILNKGCGGEGCLKTWFAMAGCTYLEESCGKRAERNQVLTEGPCATKSSTYSGKLRLVPPACVEEWRDKMTGMSTQAGTVKDGVELLHR